MTLADLPILTVWSALGGGELRGRRGKAFWRDGNGYSIALNPDRGTWFDFRDGRGGGVLALVEAVLQCDRPRALQWLEANCGLDRRLHGSPESARGRAQARARVSVLAQRLADFARGLHLVSAMRLAAASAGGLDPEEVAAWHRQAHLLAQANPQDLALLWQTMPEVRDGVERLGRRDREHAERVAWLIASILAAKQATDRRAA